MGGAVGYLCAEKDKGSEAPFRNSALPILMFAGVVLISIAAFL
jgi:hypothetical protein